MAIKKLQNDYTTPEQSKWLLELGVPADSANYCYYVKDKCAPVEIIPPGNRDTPHTFSTYANGYNDVFYPENPSLFEWDNVDVLPSWSVGRLMEIIRICNLTTEKPWVYIEQDNIHAMITAITDGVNNNMLDFSKLEG